MNYHVEYKGDSKYQVKDSAGKVLAVCKRVDDATLIKKALNKLTTNG